MNTSDSLYEKLGDERLTQLLETFYDKVFESNIIGPLFAHSEKALIINKQFCFLTQFLGGPPRYNEKYGIPKMRARHIPHNINIAARDEWLKIMKESIETLDWEPQLKIALYNCFPKVADHMVSSTR